MGDLFAHDVINSRDTDLKRVRMTDSEMTVSSLADNDLLFGRRSLVESGAGKCSLVGKLIEPTTFESSIIRVRVNQSLIRPRFVFYWLKSHHGRGRMQAIVTGTNVKGIRASVLKTLQLPCPPLRVQDSIVSILRTYDDLIENNRRRIRLLEHTTRMLYDEWFVRLRFPRHEHAIVDDGVPAGWMTRKISEVCDTVGGGTPSTRVPEYWNGDVTWVVPSDVTGNDCLALLDSERKITEKGLRESSAKVVPPETILMTSRASVGFFALMDRETATNQGFINIIPADEKLRMYLLFNLMNRVPEIRSNAKGTTYPEISKGRFRAMDVIVPESTIVKKFSDIASDIIQQVRCLKRSTHKLAAARDLLLPRLMNGETSVDPDAVR